MSEWEGHGASTCRSQDVGVRRAGVNAEYRASRTRWPRSSATAWPPGSRTSVHAGRERQRLGRAAPRHPREGLRTKPERLRRGPDRRAQAVDLHPPVLRGGRRRLVETVGVDSVVFGSDYPHPEGLFDPVTFVDEIEGLSDEDQAKIMGGNLAKLMGVEATTRSSPREVRHDHGEHEAPRRARPSGRGLRRARSSSPLSDRPRRRRRAERRRAAWPNTSS